MRMCKAGYAVATCICICLVCVHSVSTGWHKRRKWPKCKASCKPGQLW